MIKKPTISLVQATRRDLPLVKRWLAQRDIARVWGSPVQNSREMHLILASAKQDARIFLIHDEKQRPIGLVSLLHARLIASVLHDWPAHLPLAAWEIGILIGERDNRRRGIGTQALRMAHDDLPGELDEPVYAYIVSGNHGSLRMFEKLGYHRTNDNQSIPAGWSVLRYDRSRGQGERT